MPGHGNKSKRKKKKESALYILTNEKQNSPRKAVVLTTITVRDTPDHIPAEHTGGRRERQPTHPTSYVSAGGGRLREEED